nr:PREDICTED: uncharacterized protein LOC109034726 [Bemisia tabaci]
MNGISDSGAGVLRGVTALSTGTIIGILDAISSIFSTTTQVSYHAKRALSSINRSGTNAVTSVIGTAGAIVSGTLDKTGQVINAMRFAPRRPINDHEANVQGGSESQRALTLSFPAPPRNLLPPDDDSDASDEAASQPKANLTLVRDEKFDSSRAMPDNLQNYESRPPGTVTRTGEGSTTDSQISQSPESQSQRVPSSENEDEKAETSDNASRGTKHSDEHDIRQENSENRNQKTNRTNSETGGSEPPVDRDIGSGTSDAIPQKMVKNDALEKRPEKTDELHQESEGLTNRTDKEQAANPVQGAMVTSNRSGKSGAVDRQSSAFETSEGLPDSVAQKEPETLNQQQSQLKTLDKSSKNHEQDSKIVGGRLVELKPVNEHSSDLGISGGSANSHFQVPEAANNHLGELQAPNEQLPEPANSGNSLRKHIQQQGAVDGQSAGPVTVDENSSKSAAFKSSSNNYPQEQTVIDDLSTRPEHLKSSSDSLTHDPGNEGPEGQVSGENRSESSISISSTNNQTEELKAANDPADLKTTEERSPNYQTFGGTSDTHSEDYRAPDTGFKGPETSNKELSKSANSEHSPDDHIRDQKSAEDRPDLDTKLSESSTSNSTPNNRVQNESQSDDSSIGSKVSNNQPLRFANSNAQTPGLIGAEDIAEKSGTSEKYSPETVPSNNHADVPDTSGKTASGPGGSPFHPQESLVPSSLSNNHSSAPKNSDDSPRVSHTSELHASEASTSDNPAENQSKPSDANDHPPVEKLVDPSNRFSTPESHFQRPDSLDDPSKRSDDSNKSAKEVASTVDDTTKISESPSDPTLNTTNDTQQDLEGGLQKADFSEKNQHDKVGDTSPFSNDGESSSYNTGQGPWADRTHDRGTHSDEKHRILNSGSNNNDHIEKKGGAELMSISSNEASTEESTSAVMEAESSESEKTVRENLEFLGNTSKDKNNNDISV